MTASVPEVWPRQCPKTVTHKRHVRRLSLMRSRRMPQLRNQSGGAPQDGNDRGDRGASRSGSGAVIGDPEHAKQYFRNSAFPREYFDSQLEDAAYISVSANLNKAVDTPLEKMLARLKILNYIHEIETKLQAAGDLTDFRQRAITEYRKAVNHHLTPPKLTKALVEYFGSKYATKKSYIELLFAYETTKREKQQEQKTDIFNFGDHTEEAYVKQVEKLSGHTNNELKGRVTAVNYHRFMSMWARVGEVLSRVRPCAEYAKLNDPHTAVHPLVDYWTSRYSQISASLQTKFKSLKSVVLPHNVREEQSLCRADQRQLLMLLCGDVPAELFVDAKTGAIRPEQQISHHILFLTKPYHMSNTVFGVLLQNVNRFVNTVRHAGTSGTKMVGWAVLCLVQTIGLMAAALTLYRDTHSHRLSQNIVLGLAHALRTLLQLVLRFTGVSRSRIRAYRIVHDVDELMRLLQTASVSYVVWRVLWTIEKDIGHNQRVPVMRVCFQKALDNFNLTRAGHWMAQLKPGVLGESTVSGISDQQLGMMHRVQSSMKLLDLDVMKTRRATIEFYFESFARQERSRSRRQLWADLNADYHAARSCYVNPRKVRQKYLQKYPHEFRAHHFFDSYGYPRNVLQIVVAYFCNWAREEQELAMPVVPYNDSRLHEYVHPEELSPAKKLERSKVLRGSWVHLNPIQRSEFYRRSPLHSPAEVTGSPSPTDQQALFEADVHERRDYETGKTVRAHIDIKEIFTSERKYTSWLESELPNSDSVREEFRQISGWTHKLSPALQQRLVREFHLSTRSAVVDYKEFKERQLRGLDPSSKYDTATDEVPWYMVGEENAFNLFSGAQVGHYMDDYVDLVNRLYDNYKANYIKEQSDITRDDEFTIDDDKLLEMALLALRNQHPMQDLYKKMPSKAQRTVFLMDNGGYAVKEAVVRILGVYIYTVDDPKELSDRIDKLLSHRLSAQHREEVGALFRQQFLSEDEYLTDYIDKSDFVAELKAWYEQSNDKAVGGRLHAAQKHTRRHRLQQQQQQQHHHHHHTQSTCRGK